jgi:hypothetical protein
MAVVDATGEEVGTVTAVEMPGTQVRPDVPDEQATPLMSDGYLRAGGTGPFASAWYAGGSQVADVTTTEDGVVTLTVGKQELRRAG